MSVQPGSADVVDARVRLTAGALVGALTRSDPEGRAP